MDDKKINNIVTFIIYALTLILICLIVYNAYLIFTNNYFSSNPPKNSIKVGPISVEALHGICKLN